MIKPIGRLLTLIIGIILIHLLTNCSSDGMGPILAENPKDEWIQVPLRSAAQKAAGLTGGEGMQLIYGLSYAPSNPEVAYLVSDTSQVWKSIDGGKFWQMKHKGFLANGGLSLVVDPNNQNLVFVAGSTQEDFSDEFADGIYRTKDGGENWDLVKRTSFVNLGDNKDGTWKLPPP